MAQGLTKGLPKASPKTHSDATRLTRKDGVYYYRRRLPHAAGADFALSLGTRNFREAEHLIYRRAVATALTPVELRTILRD